MPTLQQRNDGGYYIRHYFHDHHTWQIWGEGVRILKNRGVAEGSKFSTDVFMHLWRRRLVYHGAIPNGEVQPAGTNPPTDLDRRIREFYGLLRAGENEAAWNILAPVSDGDEDESPVTSPERFLRDLESLRMNQWKCTDSGVFNVECDLGGCRATRMAIAFMRLWIQVAPTSVEEHEFQQIWFYLRDEWWAHWPITPKAGK